MKQYIIWVLFVIWCFIACTPKKYPANGNICRYLLIDVGYKHKNYLIEVNDSGLMKVSTGELCGKFYDEILHEDSVMNGLLSEYDFFQVHSTHQRQLTTKEQEIIKNCIAKTKDLKECNVFIEMGFKDALEIVAIIGERKYAYVDVPYDELTILLNALLDLSPVDIRKENEGPFKFTTVEEALKRGVFFHESYLNNVGKKYWWERTKEWFE